MSAACQGVPRVLGMVGVVLLSGACATGPAAPPAGPAPPAPGEAAPAAQPKPGGALRVANSVTIATLEPYAPGRYDQVIGPIYDRLVEFRNDEKARFSDLVFHGPQERGLAEKWEYTSPTTLVMNLKKGVKWHDGRPFTADDVVWTAQWTKDPASRVPRGAAHLVAVEKVEAPDPYSVRFTTRGPSASLLNRLTELYVVPKHHLEQGRSLKAEALGTGAFKLKEYVQNQKVVLERFPDYYWQGRPYLDRFEVAIGLDYSTQNAAFVAEKLDTQTVTDRPQFEAIKRSNPDIKSIKFIENVNFVLRNRLEGPLADLRVRKAIHLGLDRHELVDTVTFGDGVIPPFGLPHQEGRGVWTLPEKEYINDPGFRREKTADLQEAKRLMAEAGYPTGFKVAIKAQQGSIYAEKQMPVVLEQLKRNLGIEAEFQNLPPATAAQDENSGNYQIIVRPSRGSWGDPESFMDYFYSKSPENTTLVRDAEWDRLVEEQTAIFDPAKRAALIYKMQRHLATTYWSIPLINHAAYYLLHAWVHGVGFPQKAIPDLDTQNLVGIWLADNAPGRK